MAAIKLTSVKKIYDKKVTAVHDFNLDVADKEFIVFVGPSGCGKSTTLRMIAGLEEISEGTCEIDGKIVNDLPPKERNIAMVFQNYALYPHLSVFENIAFPLRLLRTQKTSYQNFVDRVNDKITRLNEEKEKTEDLAKIEANTKQIAQLEALKEQKTAELKAKAEQIIKATEDRIATLKADVGDPTIMASYEAKTATLKAKAEKLTDRRNKTLAKLEAVRENLIKSIDPNNKKALDRVEIKYNDKKDEINSDYELEVGAINRRLAQLEKAYLPERKIEVLEAKIKRIQNNFDVSRVVNVKMGNREIFEKVTAVAETLGITEYLSRKPRALSGGQRQRVAIGRAMVRDSKVLLMDEPLSNLDAKLRNQMRAEIILLRKKIDSTFIYVTHDQTEAMTLGDRIVIMKDGFIQQIGTPQQVFDTPANLFVAGFIGAPQMNFFNGAELVSSGDKYSVKIHGVEFPIDGANGEILVSKKEAARKVILGVRPEHMTFSIKPLPSCLECELTVSEMMGSELHLHLIGPDGSKIITRVQTMNLTNEEREAIRPGNKVYVSFEGKAMHLFDPETATKTSILHPENEYVVKD